MIAPADPIARIRALIEQAETKGAPQPVAMALATADSDGNPSVRMVLLRGIDERGLVFYTNSLSRKGREVSARRAVALCFYWPLIDEQVRVEGEVDDVSDEEADAYWRSRPRGSQLASAASRQSAPLPDRAVYEQAVRDLDAQLDGAEVPRPAEWKGYRVAPQRVEFWHEGPNRMHTRALYTRSENGWSTSALYP